MKLLPHAVCAILLLTLMSGSAQEKPYQPISVSLACSGGDCPLLHGDPQTAGMRGGLVRLKPGESVGAHSTEENEEALVILHGEGRLDIEGRAAIRLSPQALSYTPPHYRHNVTNTGKEVLEYIYIVAPSGKSVHQQMHPN